jgi:UPF0271 protein
MDLKIDLNCDLGEFSEYNPISADELIMPWITSANIACGAHAGNLKTIETTIKLAQKYGVAIGAHPSFPDRENFGRIEMNFSPDELVSLITIQIETVRKVAMDNGCRLSHVKPHGALYNLASTDKKTAEIIADAVAGVDASLILFGLSGSQMKTAAENYGLCFASEVFADRAYSDSGKLIPRNQTGAVLHDTGFVIRRALEMVKLKCVSSVTGKNIPIEADTICIHGDNPEAADFVRALYEAFRQNGIQLTSFNRK